MASVMLISVLIVKIFLAFKCELSSAHAPVVNLDSNSNTGSLLYQIIDGMYDELKKENKETVEKIETLEETNDSGLEALRSDVENKNKEIVKKIDKLEEKTDSGLEALQAELETIKDELSEYCPPPYTYNANLNLCWRLETEKKLKWTYARLQCASEGGDLIVLDTPEKIAYIQMAVAGLSIPNYDIWVGGDDQSEEGKFKWLNGSPVQGIPWQSSEPNNGGGNSDCMIIYKYDRKFYDRQCTDTYSFLCQLN